MSERDIASAASTINLFQQNYIGDEEASNQIEELESGLRRELENNYTNTSIKTKEINLNDLRKTLNDALISATHWPKIKNGMNDMAWLLTGDGKYLDSPPADKEFDGIDSLDHDRAKKLISEMVNPKLIDKANLGNVKDTLKTGLSKQILTYPTRLIIGGALETLNRTFPEPSLSSLPNESPQDYARRLNEFKLSNEWQDWNKNYGPDSAIQKAAQHGAGTARGLAHFGAHVLGKNFDASTSSSVASAKSYWNGDKYKESLASLQSRASQLNEVLNSNRLGLPLDVINEAKKDLRTKTNQIQEKLDHFLEEQKLLHPNDKKAMSLGVAFAAEIVDTAGKYVIASTVGALTAGSPLAATAAKQLWSLASYPIMDAVEKALHNYNNTTDIAKLALLRFNQLRREHGGDSNKIPDAEILNIANHVRSHYKNAEDANHERFILNTINPKRFDLAKQVSESLKEVNRLKELSNAVSPDHLSAIKGHQKIGAKIESEKNDLMYKIMSANIAEAAVENVNALTEMMKAVKVAGSFDTQRATKLINAFSESLAFAISTPTSPAQDSIKLFENAARDLGVDVNRSAILNRAKNQLQTEVENLKKNFRHFERSITSSAPHYALHFGKEIRDERVSKNKISELNKQLEILKGAININDISNKYVYEKNKSDAFTASQKSSQDESSSFSSKIKEYRNRLVKSNEKYEKLLNEQNNYTRDAKYFSEKNFGEVGLHGTLGNQLGNGIVHGMANALKNTFKYEFFSTAKNRAELGAAMIALYNGGVSQFLPKSDNLVQSLLIDEGALEAGALIAAAVHRIRGNQPPNTVGFMGRPPIEST